MKRGPDKQFDREAVLEAAMTTFWHHGCEGTGVTELLKTMGIGRQSLYDTFGDKRSLFLEALRHYHRTKVYPVLDTLKAPGSPMGNLRSLLLSWTDIPAGQQCGCFIGNSLAEFGDQDPEVNQLIGAFLQQLEDAFDGALKRARKAGELGSKLPTRDLARMLVNTIQGLALLSKLKHDPARAGAVIKTALAMLEGR